MSKKLFWENPYLTQCKARITNIDGNKVKLDQTIFFAFSGGQESDKGTINDIKVVNAEKHGDKEKIIDIAYELAEIPDFKSGDEVEVKIDGSRRIKLMKLHSATHLAYYFLTEKIGKVKVIGSNIAEDKGRFDFIYEKSIADDLPEIEQKLNEFLEENHAIVTKYDSEKSDLRWWQCNSWKMPCGGTHPKFTEEIGRVLLKRKNKGSGKQRIEIFLS